jgi:hypothetical protein
MPEDVFIKLPKFGKIYFGTANLKYTSAKTFHVAVKEFLLTLKRF